MTRRAKSNQIIRAALAPPPATRREAEFILREVYPWGERAGHPYKAWCKARAVVLAEIYGTRYYTGPEWTVNNADFEAIQEFQRKHESGELTCTGLFAAATKGQEGE